MRSVNPASNPYNNCLFRAIPFGQYPRKLRQYFDVGQYFPVLPSETVIIGLANSQGKTEFDRRRGKHVPDLPKKDYVSCAVRSFHTDMKDSKSNDDEFKAACKLFNS